MVGEPGVVCVILIVTVIDSEHLDFQDVAITVTTSGPTKQGNDQC